MQTVAGAGGAVGWLAVPSADEVREWVDGLAGSRTVLAWDGDRLLGSGSWGRHAYAVTAQNAEVRKVMVDPRARGQGVGRAVTSALVDDAREAGVEVLTLDCRGNNHGALRMYAGLGFVTTGRRPDFIAVGDERFDQVLLHLDLRAPAAAGTRVDALVRHGGRQEGPGAS
ncbi:MAG: GCN5-related N-acetyltransferase [Frankiales bacterium]|nr:GCN5-related N-acetyltransferase [Frankiales bacterium]